MRFSSAILLNEDLIAGPSSSRLPIGFRQAFTWRVLAFHAIIASRRDAIRAFCDGYQPGFARSVIAITAELLASI
jgi:hypothetical protein